MGHFPCRAERDSTASGGIGRYVAPDASRPIAVCPNGQGAVRFSVHVSVGDRTEWAAPRREPYGVPNSRSWLGI